MTQDFHLIDIEFRYLEIEVHLNICFEGWEEIDMWVIITGVVRKK